MDESKVKMRPLKPMPNFIFMSRWLQVPLYLGLIVAQAIYVYQFGVELKHLVEGLFFSSAKMTVVVRNVAACVADTKSLLHQRSSGRSRVARLASHYMARRA